MSQSTKALLSPPLLHNGGEEEDAERSMVRALAARWGQRALPAVIISVDIPARMLLMPFPGSRDDLIEPGIFRLPAELPLGFVR